MTAVVSPGDDIAVEVRFGERHEPGLPPGAYTLTVKQDVSAGPATFGLTRTFVVAGQQAALVPADVAAVYPPAGSVGDHAAVLPHVVLNRSTLPWERQPGPGLTDAPWLAVLLFDDGEKPTPVPVDAAAPGQPAADGAATARAIDVPWPLLQALLPPTVAELRYLAHVRQTCDAAGNPVGDERAVVVGNRLPADGATSTAHLVSVENFYNANGMLIAPPGGGPVRLVSLLSWAFTCPHEPLGFVDLLLALDRSPPTLRLPAVGQADADAHLGAGACPLLHGLRRGGRTVSWYRGPLAPDDPGDAPAPPARAADALLRYDPATGLFDASLAAAWELGRFLALRSKAVSIGLFRWRRETARSARAGQQAGTVPPLPVTSPAATPDGPPAEVARWFDGLRTLVDVPFNYLVPDERMLPAESLRFFVLDAAWVAAALDGAASIGRVGAADLADDAALLGSLVSPGGPRSGVLLRSAVVSGWPGLLVDAADTAGVPCPPVRVARLSPSVLLAVFEGRLDSVSLHLQPELLHFGFDRGGAAGTPAGLYKVLRGADGVETTGTATIQVTPIPWRQPPGAPAASRVVAAAAMASAMATAFPAGNSPFQAAAPNPAEFALQMIEGVPRVTFWRTAPRPNS
ncbi:MAG TPA: hypothetical protein VD866_08575 [Urbifossiella sp.]|nr:hypothetical protein [Urbifossiella sp.]